MKKLTKAILTTVLALTFVMPSVNVFAAAAAPAKDPFALPTQAEITAKMPKTAPKGQIIYGSTTQLNADFFSGWSNNATNADVKQLISGGYGTTVLTQDGYYVNPIVVKKWNSVMNDDKTKTYTFQIYDNLTYNNGSKITADDYIFSLLLSASPQFKELKTTSAGNDIFVGYEEFFEGKTQTFSGVRKIDQYTFTLTLKAKEVPNYFELAYIGLGPLPLSVIAPGVKITDDGKGATISKEFTAELLNKTILDPKTGYRYNPKVTPGPYQFDKFDEATSTATMSINKNFLGNMDGTKPQIEKLIIKLVTQATMMDELAAGQVDLLAGLGDGLNINKGLDLADAKKALYTNYPRSGYGKIQFQVDFGPTQFTAVRQAIAYCLDRDDFCRQFTSGYGIVVNGYYGASQWEYIENKDELDERLTNYTYNIAKAKELLTKDGWIYDEKGGKYVEGAGKIRYKRVDGKYMPLIIEWIGSENNQVTDLINTMLPKEAEKVGMKINLTQAPFATLTAHLYRNDITEPKYHMYNLATGITATSSPWYYYSTDPQYLGHGYNNNFMMNEEMNKIVQAMKNTDPTDKEGWASRWVAFQSKWNELVPDIPLYSNLYHDFYNSRLENYTPSSMWEYRYCIQRANVK